MSNARELSELAGSYGTGGFVGMKNRIINGAMMIDQRNAGASVSGASVGYTLDRWAQIGGGGSITVQRTTSVVPSGFSYAYSMTVGSANTRNATDYGFLYQIIEGTNVADLDLGLATASTLTLSFWVRSSVSGLYSGVLASGDNTRTYGFTYTINAANTWEQKFVTIVGDTSGGKTAYPVDNTEGLRLKLDLGSGSNYQVTAGSWTAATNKIGVAGTVSWAQTAGATFYITGVQLEKGSTATSFDYRPYGTELALCQRYFYLGGTLFQGANSAAGVFGGLYPFPCPMRTAPSVSQSGTITIYGPNFADYNASSPSVSAYAPYSFGRVSFGTGSGGGAGVGTYCYGSGTLSFSAEL